MKSKLDWLLKYKQNEIDKIMKDNAVYIQFPLVKNISEPIKFSGEKEAHVNRAIRLFHDLVSVRWHFNGSHLIADGFIGSRDSPNESDQSKSSLKCD